METGQEAALVPVQRRVIAWGPDGLPVLTARPVLTKAHIQSLYMVVAAQPYEVVDPFAPDFGKYDGMTVAEVMVRKQLDNAAKTGDLQAIEIVMDRLIGRPLSKNESVSVSATYEEYLKALAAKTGAPVEAPAIIDVVPEPFDFFKDPA